MTYRLESKGARVTVGVLAVLGVIYAIWVCRGLLADVIIAITVASAITPLAELGQKRQIPRWVTVILCYVLVASFYTGIGFLLAGPIKEQTEQFKNRIPQYRQELQSKYRDFMEFVQHVEMAAAEQPAQHHLPHPLVAQPHLLGPHPQPDTTTTTTVAPPEQLPGQPDPTQAPPHTNGAPVSQDDMKTLTVNFLRRAFDVSTGFFGLMVHGILVLFLSAYFAITADEIWSNLLGWVPDDKRAEVESLIQPLGQRMGGYIRGQMLVATAVGAFFAIGYSLMGLNYAVVLGVLAGVLNLVPYVGSLTATILAIFVALNQNPILIVLVIILAVIEQTIESNFFVPFLLGKQIDLHPLVVFFSVLIGAQLAGVPGVFIFVPLTSGALYLAERYYLKRAKTAS